jgi:hypothetical protein
MFDFRRFSRHGWPIVDREAYEDAVDLDKWLGPKYPELHKYWVQRQLRYLQQVLDGE